MKVLSIGNSFSTDAHTYVPSLAAAVGEKLTLCNLFIAGCSIEDHYRNYIDENEDYAYECYLPDEIGMIRPEGIALHEAVEDDDWDVITLQQCSPLSGVKESYKPYMAELAAYCRLMHPEAKIMLHQTWAYEKGCPVPQFQEYYNGDQNKMYEMLTECYAEISVEAEADDIIPSGRAWQTARQTKIGDRLTRDGYHGNELGQFLASCCFYEKIFGKDVTENPFDLPEFDKPVSDLLKICAHIACEEGITRRGGPAVF